MNNIKKYLVQTTKLSLDDEEDLGYSEVVGIVEIPDTFLIDNNGNAVFKERIFEMFCESSNKYTMMFFSCCQVIFTTEIETDAQGLMEDARAFMSFLENNFVDVIVSFDISEEDLNNDEIKKVYFYS